MTRLTLLSAPVAFAVALLGTPVSAEQFALFVYETPADFAARNDPARAEAYWGGWGALAQEMTAAGIIRGGGPLTVPTEGAVVTVRRGLASSEPGAEAAEALSGWFVIDVADRAAAEEWAAKVPAAATARIEVRPILDVPMAR